MDVLTTAIPEIRMIRPKRFADQRGYFAEIYNREQIKALAGIAVEFVQDNVACSAAAGTVRGLHFQAPPFAQDKLVCVLRGAILDVAVDIRRGSPTYGRHVAVTLDAAEGAQLFIPIGFAHGYCTTEPDSVVLYKVSNFYAPRYESGLAWDDPDLRIPWPFGHDGAELSPKDRTLPRLRDFVSPFEFAD